MSSYSTTSCGGVWIVRPLFLAIRFMATACVMSVLCPALQAQSETVDLVTYDQVRPVFRKHCVTCHNQDRARGDLNLSSLDGIKAGSSSGAAVVPRKPDESPIYLSAAHVEDPKMPPNSPKIPQRELDLVRRWIEGGLAERSAVASHSTFATSPPSAAVASSSTVKPMAMNAFASVEPLARSAPITALAISPTAPLVAVSGRKQVVLFEGASEKPAKALAFPEGDVFALQFSRDGSLLLAGGGVGGMSGKVVAFAVATGQRVFEVGDESDVVLALATSPDSSLVALGGPGRNVKVFRATDGQLVTTLRKHTDWILSLVYSPDGLLLASSDRFGTVQVWEAASGKEFHTLRGHVGPVHALAWSADTDRLLTAGEDGKLRFWNMHDGTQASQWDGDVGPILSAGYDGRGHIVCGGRNRRIAIWSADGKQLQSIAQTDEIGEVALAHDASHVATGDAAGNLSVHRLETGQLVSHLELPVAPTSRPTKSSVAVSSNSSASGPAQSIADRPAAAKANALPLPAELIAAEAEAKRAALDLANTREAFVAAEGAVKLTEQSLAKLRDSAAKLHPLVASREAAAKLATERAAELRRLAESQQSSAAGDSRPAEQQRLLSQRLAQMQSLQRAAAAVAEQIRVALAESQSDAGLQAAAQLAKDLANKLSSEVELAVAELRRVESAVSATAQPSKATTAIDREDP